MAAFDRFPQFFYEESWDLEIVGPHPYQEWEGTPYHTVRQSALHFLELRDKLRGRLAPLDIERIYWSILKAPYDPQSLGLPHLLRIHDVRYLRPKDVPYVRLGRRYGSYERPSFAESAKPARLACFALSGLVRHSSFDEFELQSGWPLASP